MLLVTGASGFIGRNLCCSLQNKNLQVRGMIRPAMGLEFLPPGVEPVRVEDLSVHTAWESIFSGVSSVIHLAAKVPSRNSGGLPDFLRINVNGTSRLAQAAADAGVRRLVYVSSAKVHGEGAREPYREGDCLTPHSPYAVSKQRAEQALSEIARTSGLETVILRPPVVYGPGMKGNFLRLLQLVKWGVPLPVGEKNALRSMLFVGNLVDAINSCLFHPAAAGKIFLARDGEDLALAEIVSRIAGAMGRGARCISIPGKKTSEQTLRVDDSLIRQTLGWTPPFTCEHGLQQTVHWYLQGRR